MAPPHVMREPAIITTSAITVGFADFAIAIPPPRNRRKQAAYFPQMCSRRGRAYPL
jgi:hypothetical protein